MINKTEYTSNYVWHENAYSNKPERQFIPGRFRHCPLFSRHKGSLQQLSQPQQQQQQQILERVLYFPLHPSSRRQEEVVRENDSDENQMLFSEQNKEPTNTRRQRLSPTRRRYSLDADARGINSHFLPASLEVLLDLGMTSYKSLSSTDTEISPTSEVGAKCANQYFTSVYKNDFSCTNSFSSLMKKQ